MHLGCCSTFGKRKNTVACGSSVFALSESLATPPVHGSRNPARKTIRHSFSHWLELYQTDLAATRLIFRPNFNTKQLRTETS